MSAAQGTGTGSPAQVDEVDRPDDVHVVVERGAASGIGEPVEAGRTSVVDAPLRHRAIIAYADERPDWDARRIAEALVRSMGARVLRAWAIGYVQSVVEANRRDRARRVEIEAQLAALRAQAEREQAEREAAQAERERQARAAWAQAERERRQARQARSPEETAKLQAERQARRDAPFLLVRDQERPWRCPYLFADVSPLAFKQWMGERFDPWLDGHRQALAEEHAAGNPVAPQWLARFLHRFDLGPDPGLSGLSPVFLIVQESLYEVARQTRLEVTQDLLGTRFALGDGTSVTWGEATIAHHEQRIALLTSQATGTIATAARHQAAITMLREAGVGCLAELGESSRSVG